MLINNNSIESANGKYILWYTVFVTKLRRFTL
jgi:hypothetical protein